MTTTKLSEMTWKAVLQLIALRGNQGLSVRKEVANSPTAGSADSFVVAVV